MQDISCPVCFNVFLAQSIGVDRRPVICCQNGHNVCADCFDRLKDYESDLTCPECRQPLLDSLIVNRMVMDVIENFAKAFNQVPEIAANEMTLSSEPFAMGMFGDIYDAKWRNQDVAVKVPRLTAEFDKHRDQLRLEANLAIGLHHPNIVRLFGTTKVKGDLFGIVMEKVDNGSLDKHMLKLSQQTAVRISLGIIDGLEYVHSRKVAHRDLKPQNVLLSGPQLIPKITDFGVSKVMQTVITNSAMVGTPKYVAPELMEPGKQYGYSVDIYSLSIILFEMFSGQPAERSLGGNMMQIMFAVAQGKRPQFPNDFPSILRPVIESGWAHEGAKRPNLNKFREALLSMLTSKLKVSPPRSTDNKRVSMESQSGEVAKVNLPLPVLSLTWSSDCEVLNSAQLRAQMVEDMKTKSNMRRIINESVLSVMRVIPRHLFIEGKRMAADWSQQELINASYIFNKPIAATMHTNESSPEIIGTQLSMTEIIQGQSVLLVGMKGGYIQSLVAQLVGVNGTVVTASSHSEAMDVCRDRVNRHCPFKSIVEWVPVNDVKNRKSIVSAVQERKRLFHTIIYCGSVDSFPSELVDILQPAGNVSIMAPVKTGNGDSLQFQLYIRRNDVSEMRTITDFGVIFEDVK
jgi:serine/threonine protein kinase